VTNTYLASAVHDVSGGILNVFCLAKPGVCPGHFDMSPEQLRRLLGSHLLLHFDFQSGIADQLERWGRPIVPILGRGGMCIPQTYLDTCREIIPHLVEQALLPAVDYTAQLKLLEARLEHATSHIREQIEQHRLSGTKVLCSHHQADFARWLGLDVVQTIRGIDSSDPGSIEVCIRIGREQQIAFVIANLQEGMELPRRMAQEIGSRLVVFSNFPDTITHPDHAFEQLILANVDHLIQACL
jgi:ABC-type Zn uptake system ZnuABC Zn-binding protein ZnuA